MKRYARCAICGARVLVEYGTVLREHVSTQLAPGGRWAGGVAPLCRGPQAAPTAPVGETCPGQPSSADQGASVSGEAAALSS